MESTPSHRVVVQVFPAFANRLTRVWLRKVAELALSGTKGQALNSGDEIEAMNISLVIADDETVHNLNLEYRGLDETTDVLAFPLWESRETSVPDTDGFFLPPQEAGHVGEIVISYPQAARQARDGKKTVKSEMALLIVHGVLHLLGYDHADPQQEREMWARQDEILAALPER